MVSPASAPSPAPRPPLARVRGSVGGARRGVRRALRGQRESASSWRCAARSPPCFPTRCSASFPCGWRGAGHRRSEAGGACSTRVVPAVLGAGGRRRRRRGSFSSPPTAALAHGRGAVADADHRRLADGHQHADPRGARRHRLRLAHGRGAAARRASASARADALRARAELQLLRSQLHPHFVLNVLHALLGLVRRDPARAEAALERLGDLLRFGQWVQQSGADFVPLSREWELRRELPRPRARAPR